MCAVASTKSRSHITGEVFYDTHNNMRSNSGTTIYVTFDSFLFVNESSLC